jgi:hypothetical protein
MMPLARYLKIWDQPEQLVLLSAHRGDISRNSRQGVMCGDDYSGVLLAGR